MLNPHTMDTILEWFKGTSISSESIVPVEQEEIIETLMLQEVVDLIKTTLTENNLPEEYLNPLVKEIYYDNFANMNVDPKNVLYDTKRVHSLLQRFIENCPKED